MLGLSKKEKEESIKRKEQIKEKLKTYNEKVAKYYSLIGQEVKIGLGVYGVLDQINEKYAGCYDFDEYNYYYNVRILSAHVTKKINNNICVSSGVLSSVDSHIEERDSIFEYITIPCDVILKLNGVK